MLANDAFCVIKVNVVTGLEFALCRDGHCLPLPQEQGMRQYTGPDAADLAAALNNRFPATVGEPFEYRIKPINP